MNVGLFHELAEDVPAFLLMAVIWLVVGLAVRRGRGRSSVEDAFMLAIGTFAACTSIPMFVGTLAFGFAGAQVRVDFKARLAAITAVPYRVTVVGTELAAADARTVVLALGQTYGQLPSHSGPTTSSVLEIHSAKGTLSLTVRDDSLPGGSL